MGLEVYTASYSYIVLGHFSTSTCILGCPRTIQDYLDMELEVYAASYSWDILILLYVAWDVAGLFRHEI